MRTDWNPILKNESKKDYWKELQRFVDEERSTNHVYPPHQQVFNAFHLTPYANLKVLILGQDPYHGQGQANGLCFSVETGIAIPPSLRNIFKELEADLGISPPKDGDLTPWAKEGVLLLNATLTVRQNEAGSHQGKGWEIFTDQVIRDVNMKPERVIFILWGASARRKKELIDLQRHVIIESVHPSPLSAHRGFLGSRPFSRTNKALSEVGIEPISWNL
ncbi:MAG: uracil-DNA glycosylase [Acidimicrobiales bacterium]|nr:uracil-DNA glycosylase [Acidimicrobiales bacterium]MDP6298732.1 uracil-DNA glycosylase [Acidimicrobiales bacterium]HJM28030.1 uracil-DNA glycosylase [Acidimicrobiales bacterium]HJM96623.1 uracil-DNA glycosylase [Acidimicrobiales bacterium]